MAHNYKKLAILGHPVQHSKSPLIHKYWIKKYGLDGQYDAVDSPPDTLERTLRRCLKEDYNGFNVTLPHKHSIRSYCDFFDTTSHEIGAVNTLHLKDHKLYGSNTDAYGFSKNLEMSHPDFEWGAGPAVVLGAGGAARAVAYALKDKNVPVIKICNRTLSKAGNIVADMGGSVMPWEERTEAIKECNLLINTTLLGMEGQSLLEMPLETLPSHATVYDIVYAPLITPLLQEAQARGNPIVTGIGMLLYQAQQAFKTWYGIVPEVDNLLIQKVLA